MSGSTPPAIFFSQTPSTTAFVASTREPMSSLPSPGLARRAIPVTAAHSDDGGAATLAGIHGALAVKVGTDGTAYILERQGSTLRAVDPRTGIIATIAGTGVRSYTGDNGPALAATFDAPKELAIDRE